MQPDRSKMPWNLMSFRYFADGKELHGDISAKRRESNGA
jgi:hypothetical protein